MKNHAYKLRLTIYALSKRGKRFLADQVETKPERSITRTQSLAGKVEQYRLSSFCINVIVKQKLQNNYIIA